MHDQLFFTAFLNRIFAGPVDALLRAVHIEPHYPDAPITNPVAMQILVAFGMIIFFAIVRSRLSVDKPGALQHTTELIHEFGQDQSKDIIGAHSERYVPFAITIFVFVLLCNLLGLVPGFVSPTQFPYVPFGLAICTWFYYHFHGVREQGIVHYTKHFAGPVWWLAPLMFPIEIISHCARLMSLTIRLFANMFAGEMVTLAFFSLVPLGIPLIFMGLHVLVAFVQAFIFFVLTMIYLTGAVSVEEH